MSDQRSLIPRLPLNKVFNIALDFSKRDFPVNYTNYIVLVIIILVIHLNMDL